MYYTIYKTTNKINGKIYIGMHATNNPFDDYLGSGKHLKRAIEKYGPDNFQKEILHIFDNEEDMKKKEAEIITEDFCNRLDTYNIIPGGKGGFSYINRTGKNLRTGAVLSIETRNKMSAKLKGRKSPLKGKSLNWNQETKDKHSKSMSDALTGKPKSNEHKEKLRQSALKNYQELTDDEKSKQKELMLLARTHLLEVVSNETREKLSIATKKSWETRSRPIRDWVAIQADFDAGMPKDQLYQKHGLTRNIIREAKKIGNFKGTYKNRLQNKTS